MYFRHPLTYHQKFTDCPLKSTASPVMLSPFVLNKSIKNLEQIITVLGNFQHTDHYFFGHNNREFVLVWLVQCWVLRCESVSQFCTAQSVTVGVTNVKNGTYRCNANAPIYQSKKLSILSPIVCSLVLLGSMKSLAVCNTFDVNFLASVDCQSRTPMITTRTVFMVESVKNG